MWFLVHISGYPHPPCIQQNKNFMDQRCRGEINIPLSWTIHRFFCNVATSFYLLKWYVSSVTDTPVYCVWFCYFYLLLFQPRNNKNLCLILRYSFQSSKAVAKVKRHCCYTLQMKKWSQRDEMTWQETPAKKNVARFVDLLCSSMTPPLHLSRNH